MLLNIADFELLYDYILVEPVRAESNSKLVKPDQYDDKPEFGLVVRIGTGRLLEDGTVIPLKMKPGDTIYFGKYSSLKVRSDGKDYLLIRDDDVMAVLSNESTRKKIPNRGKQVATL